MVTVCLVPESEKQLAPGAAAFQQVLALKGLKIPKFSWTLWSICMSLESVVGL